MKKLLPLLTLINILFFDAKAQVMPYGVIDTTDLKMTSCAFEKDANAEVLFDQALVTYKGESIVMERHKRVKIFNSIGKDQANIRIEFFGAHRDEVITDVVAETINLNDKSIEYTPVDKKLIYTEVIDKSRKAIIFTFPNVREGSIVEFKYTWKTPYPYNYPDWSFQSALPTRYSEFDAEFKKNFLFNYFRKVYQPISRDTIFKIQGTDNSEHVWVLSNIRSYKTEPFMDYPEDYLQCVLLKPFSFTRVWETVGNSMLEDEDFGEQLKKNLTNEEGIAAKAKALKTNDEKIAYLFDTVKKSMNWNKVDDWFTIDGIKKAWDKKTGNSTEINLILYRLLRLANINGSLMSLCTRDNGKINPEYPTTSNLDKTVVYFPIDSSKYYILDASSPYNTYNNVPTDLMGLNALLIDVDKKKFSLTPIKVESAKETILISGEIKPDGKLEGSSQISSSAQNREKYLKKYGELGEKKYIDRLQEKDKDLKVLSLKMDNVENDTLPLIQTFEFNYKSTEPDGDYMYFNPNVFTSFEANPFLSETRVSNIDFGCLYSYSINGRYKVPAGYKADIIPKSVSMQMPDKGIVFRRFAAEEDGIISIRYTINYKRSLYSKDEYPSIRDFYKKMYEMLNEQIVFKKI